MTGAGPALPIEALVCHVQGQLPPASLSAASVAREEVRYRLDQRLGPIKCIVRRSGLFSGRGQLSRFTCDLALNRADPRCLWIDLDLDLTSFALCGSQELRAVRCVPWFDVTEHPAARFRSSAVAVCGPSRHLLRGLLEVAGVTRPQVLDVALSERRKDLITGADVADLLLTGRLPQTMPDISPSDIVASCVLELRLLATLELEAG